MKGGIEFESKMVLSLEKKKSLTESSKDSYLI